MRYCQENNIVLTAYSPLKDGVMQNEVLTAVARKHGANGRAGGDTLAHAQTAGGDDPDVEQPAHLRQNLEALTLELDEEDVQRLNQATGH